MAMTPNDVKYRDSRANQVLVSVHGHAAVGLVVAKTRKVFDGWMYWGEESMIFFADTPIFDGSREMLMKFSEVKIPKTRYLLYNGELSFDSVTPSLVFHSTRGKVKLIEKAIREYFNGL
jgi:hypothetical protein